MDLLSILYRDAKDIFYLTSSYLSPHDLLALSSSNRLCRYLLYHCAYQNLWLQWWQENISDRVLPIGSIETMRREVCRMSKGPKEDFDVSSFIEAGYDKAVLRHLKTPEELSDAMVDVISENNLGLFREFLKRGCTINVWDDFWLEVAVYGNVSCEIVETILKAGIDVNYYTELSRDDDDATETVLCAAVNNNNLEMVQLLMKYGATTNLMEGHLLISAIGNIDIFKLLVQAGAHLDLYVNLILHDMCCGFNYDQDGTHVDHKHTIDNLNISVLEYILKTQTITAYDKTHYLDHMIQLGSLEGVRLFLKHNAPVGEDTLEIACLTDNLEMVKLIHQHGGVYNGGISVINCQDSVIRYCLANFDLVEEAKSLLLIRGFLQQKHDLISLMKENKAEIDAREATRLLKHMVIKRNIDVTFVEMLLQIGAGVADPHLLAIAAQSGKVEVIRSLLQAGAPLSPKALLIAIAGGYVELAEYLLECGLKIEANNYSALSRALEWHQFDVVRMLIKRNLLPEYIWRYALNHALKSRQVEPAAVLKEFEGYYQKKRPGLVIVS